MYKNATAAKAKENILVYIKELESPLEITEVSACTTNHIKSETTMVTTRGTQYKNADFNATAPLAILGLYKKAKNTEAVSTRAKAWRYVTNNPRLITCEIK